MDSGPMYRLCTWSFWGMGIMTSASELWSLNPNFLNLKPEAGYQRCGSFLGYASGYGSFHGPDIDPKLHTNRALVIRTPIKGPPVFGNSRINTVLRRGKPQQLSPAELHFRLQEGTPPILARQVVGQNRVGLLLMIEILHDLT